MIKSSFIKKKMSSWGMKRIHADVYDLNNFQENQVDTFIPYGNGRGYGDSALGQNMVEQTKHQKVISFDEKKGVIHCEAGVLLSEILAIVIPEGWFLKVTPGTKLITLGGAVAADVHGKNHHKVGCFSESVNFLKLRLPNNNTYITCSKTENIDLFKATCGGMGLTGIITEVNFNLMKIKGTYIDQNLIKTQTLKEVFTVLEEQNNASYSVAWLDLLNLKKEQIKGVVFLGEHADDEVFEFNNNYKLNIKFCLPSFLINKISMRLYNWNYFKKMKQGSSKTNINSFFYPLDTLRNWNRIYGKKGLVQYQFVVPQAVAFKAVSEIITMVLNSKHHCYLAVLKKLGPKNQNHLSFPLEGYTLAMDFKMNKRLYAFLHTLDKELCKYGGRVYLAKDSCMLSETFEKGYPEQAAFKELRKKNGVEKLTSLQSKRLGVYTEREMKEILILGAKSDIAKACAQIFAQEGYHLQLAGRNIKDLEPFKKDLEEKHQVSVSLLNFDVLDLESHQPFVENLPVKPYGLVCCVGYLGNQQLAEENEEEAKLIWDTNFTGCAHIINIVSNQLKKNKEGFIIGVSSVAGNRGRKSNYYYGSAKAGFSAYLSGLRGRLAEFNIKVITVKPGFVATQMTSDLELPKLLTTTPKVVAQQSLKALKKGTNVLYVKWFWRYIMWVIALIPEAVFKKTNL